MLSIDATFLWILASFVVFMLLMKTMFFDAVARIKQARMAHLESDASTAEAARQQAALHEKDWQAQLTEAHHKTQALMAKARLSATSQAQSRIDAARSQAQSTVDTALTSLGSWRVETLEALSSEQKALSTHVLDTLSKPSQTSVLTASSR
ncbi:MAG: ATP synthase F0 subunit B [Vampirovibrionales bacterium]|nr:ATP synthase F0 subunit B [Vampirovibrionales bacterium]